jgi:hypothetical protein
MTLKPGDKVYVKGWDGEVHTVDAALQGTVVLRSDERVKVERCTPVKRAAKFPEDWGRKAEFSNGDGETHIYRVIGYNYIQGIDYTWVAAVDTYGSIRTFKHCYIYEREQS